MDLKLISVIAGWVCMIFGAVSGLSLLGLIANRNFIITCGVEWFFAALWMFSDILLFVVGFLLTAQFFPI